jgi:hypothetical protein
MDVALEVGSLAPPDRSPERVEEREAGNVQPAAAPGDLLERLLALTHHELARGDPRDDQLRARFLCRGTHELQGLAIFPALMHYLPRLQASAP